MEISLIISIRNRDLKRLRQVIESFRKQTSFAFEIIVSDYGSTNPSHQDLADFCKDQQARLVVSYSEGLPWSAAWALNNGVRAATGQWLCLVDVDMILLDPVLDYLARQAALPEVYHLEAFWPQSPTQPYQKAKVNRFFGVFTFLHWSWFEKLDGLCEDIEFWGLEDNEWVNRLRKNGATVKWLSSKDFRLVHSWHLPANTQVNRPDSAVWKSVAIEINNQITNWQKPDWGRLLTIADRPILARLHDPKDYVTIEIPTDQYPEFVPRIQAELERGSLIKLNWQSRRIVRKLSAFSTLFLKCSRPFEAAGLQIQPMINHNLESFLLSRSAFDWRLQDYYLMENQEGAWLLGTKTK